MNDSPEEEEDEATTDILIGEGDDWPEDYSDGFDAPLKVISEILLDTDAWDLPISWPRFCPAGRMPGNCWTALNQLYSSSGAYKLFDAVEGCSVDHESWGGDSPGRSGCAGSLCSSDLRSTNKRSRRS